MPTILFVFIIFINFSIVRLENIQFNPRLNMNPYKNASQKKENSQEKKGKLKYFISFCRIYIMIFEKFFRTGLNIIYLFSLQKVLATKSSNNKKTKKYEAISGTFSSVFKKTLRKVNNFLSKPLYK